MTMLENAIDLLYASIPCDADKPAGLSDALVASARCLGAESATLRQGERWFGGHDGESASAVRLRRTVAAATANAPKAVLTLTFSSPCAACSSEREGGLDFLASHVARVYRAHQAHERADEAARLTERVADRMPIGVCVVDERATVVLVNDAGRTLLATRNAVAVDEPGHLVCSTPETTSAMHAAVFRASRQAHSGDWPFRLVTTSPSARGSSSLIIEVEPLRRVDDQRSVTRNQALLTLIDPEARYRIDLDRLSELYRLSQAEQAVLQLMLSGLTNRQIAALRSVATETIRSQASSLLGKLNVSRRSELFSVVSTLYPACSSQPINAPRTAP